MATLVNSNFEHPARFIETEIFDGDCTYLTYISLIKISSEKSKDNCERYNSFHFFRLNFKYCLKNRLKNHYWFDLNKMC